MRGKVCIYTICTGGYDDLKEPRRRVPGADYFLITDDNSMTLPGYTTKVVEIREDAVRTQRHYKIWPFDLLPGYDLYVYYDASYQIIGNLGDLISRFKGGFGVMRHPTRDCIYQEGDQIVKLGKARLEEVKQQLDQARSIGVPERFGLQQTGILIRTPDEQTRKLSLTWLNQLQEGTHRDQLSLPIAIHLTGIQPVYIHRWMLGGAFKQFPHKEKVKPGKTGKIIYLQPFSRTLDIGGEINEQISRLNPDDYVCILDHDMCFLHPKSKVQIEDVIAKYGNSYDLFGVTTNRIGSAHQCYQGKRSDDPNLINHILIAEKLHEEQYCQIEETKQGIAGFFMLFKKSLWDRIKFRPHTPHFDTFFSKEVIKSGGKIAIMRGVYCLHIYRIFSKNPQHEFKHLQPGNMEGYSRI